MNTLKAVLKHLNKEDNVELSSEKVELATVKEAEAVAKEMSKLLSDAVGLVTPLDRAYANLKDAVDKAENHLKEVRKAKSELTNQVKELGINPKDVPAIQQLESSRSFAMDNLKRIKARLK